jgi:O-antigen/teichoic acid export membrane protein
MRIGRIEMAVIDDRGSGTPVRVARNAASLMVAEVLIQGMSFIPAVYISRVLGAAQYGKYILALTFASLFVAVAEFGLKEVLVREVARHRDAAGKVAVNVLLMRLGLSIASLILTVAAAIIVGYPQDTVYLICLVAVMVSINALTDVFRGVFHGFERMEYDGAARVVERLLAVVTGLLLLLAGYGVFGVIVALPLASLAMFFATWWITARRFCRVPLAWSDSTLRRSLFKASVPLALAAFLLTVRLRIDTLILSLLTDEKTVGLYGAAFSLIMALRFIPFFFNRAVFPILSRTGLHQQQSFQRLVEKCLKYLLLLALPLAVGLNLLSDRIVHLIYGSEFASSGPVLAWLSCSLLLAFVTTFYGNLVIAVDRQRVVTIATLIGAASAVGANLLLIPHWGAKGAAVAAVVSEAAVFVTYSYYVYRHVGSVHLPRLVIRPGLAALVMGLVLYLTPHWSMFIAIPVGLAVYGVSALGVRVLSPDDWDLLKRALVPSGGR